MVDLLGIADGKIAGLNASIGARHITAFGLPTALDPQPSSEPRESPWGGAWDVPYTRDPRSFSISVAGASVLLAS